MREEYEVLGIQFARDDLRDQRNLHHCHFVQHESHVNYPANTITPGLKQPFKE